MLQLHELSVNNMAHVSMKFREIQTDCLTIVSDMSQAFKDCVCEGICVNDRGSTRCISVTK